MYLVTVEKKKGIRRGRLCLMSTFVDAKNYREACKVAKDSFRDTFGAYPFNAKAIWYPEIAEARCKVGTWFRTFSTDPETPQVH